MSNPDIQAMIANAVATALASQAPATPNYFGEADELTKRANQLRKLGIANLEVTDDETFAVVRQSVVSGIACEESKHINKQGGTRLSDDQIADRKLAKEEHKEAINDKQFKADMSALVGADETELQSFSQSLPTKEGKVTRTLKF